MGADAPSEAKSELRARLRRARRSLPDLEARSARLWHHVDGLEVVQRASLVMAFESVHGEPITSGWVDRVRARGARVVMPEDEPDPREPDVVVVPGVAFTRAGDRLGQGGGWYDRFLPRVREDAVTVGVAFGIQLVDALPTEPHDVRVDVVVTDAGVASPDRR